MRLHVPVRCVRLDGMAVRDIAVALTIAGSDSGGGAGIQADLRTFHALGLWGTSAITCVTAQNPGAVSHIQAMDVEVVRGQIDRVREAFPVSAIKTGMLYNTGIIKAVADALRHFKNVPVVIDPVMVSSSGARLLQDDAVDALVDDLIPHASVLTPNLPEAELLLGCSIDEAGGQSEMALALYKRFSVDCVLKGGHLEGSSLRDVLCTKGHIHEYIFERAPCGSSHGTGCTFAAALTALLACGHAIESAVDGARNYVKACLEDACDAGNNRVMSWGCRPPSD